MKLYETLSVQLKKEPNFVTDNGKLKEWNVLNKALNFDKELVTKDFYQIKKVVL